MSLGMSTTLRNARLDAITTAAGDAATIKLYAGTRPATGGAATTLLGTLTCGTPFAAGASAGVLTLTAVAADSSADNAGVASWARLATSGGTHVMDMSVTATGGGGDLTMDNVDVEAGGTITPGTITITESNA